MARELSFALIVVMLASPTTFTFVYSEKAQAFAQAGSSTMNDDNSWYVGKGARENTYMKYQIQFNEMNGGQPFNMTIYFDKFNSTGKYWIAPVFVEDGKGHALNATFHLFDSNLGILPDSQIPSNMKAYQDAYSETLDWLSAFAQLPQSLDAKNWGQIAAPDLVIVRNLGNERVQVPGGAFDTTIFGRIDNTTEHRVWINKDLPYPVKGEHFESSLDNASLSLTRKFELLEVGDGMQNDKVGYSNYVLQTNDGGSYNIQYKITNTKLEKIETGLPRILSMTIFVSPSSDGGKLELRLPRNFIDQIANIGGLSVFPNPGPPNHGAYLEGTTDCDYRTISIDFGNSVSKIELLGTRPAEGNSGSNGPYDNPVAQVAVLRIKSGDANKDYFVESITGSKICNWNFTPEERKLQLSITKGEIEKERATNGIDVNRGMRLTIPTGLFAGPYTVMIDSKKIDFELDYAPSTASHSEMYFSYGENASAIEIIGTKTSVPEFGSSSLTTIITAASIFGLPLAHRYLKRKE